MQMRFAYFLRVALSFKDMEKFTLLSAWKSNRILLLLSSCLQNVDCNKQQKNYVIVVSVSVCVCVPQLSTFQLMKFFCCARWQCCVTIPPAPASHSFAQPLSAARFLC